MISTSRDWKQDPADWQTALGSAMYLGVEISTGSSFWLSVRLTLDLALVSSLNSFVYYEYRGVPTRFISTLFSSKLSSRAYAHPCTDNVTSVKKSCSKISVGHVDILVMLP
jgi:fucose permease